MNPKRLLLSVLFLLAIFSQIGADRTRAAAGSDDGWKIEDVLSAPFPEDLVASPAGDRIAWTFNAEGKRNIWVAEGPGYAARQLTQYNEDTGQEIANLSFTFDGKWVVYTRGGGYNSAGEFPNPTSDPAGVVQAIHAVSTETGREMRLAAGGSPVVSPVDYRIAFSREGQIWLVEIVDGSEAHQLFSARGNNSAPTWSPNGKQMAFVSARGSHSLIGICDLEKARVSYLAPSVDRDSVPRWSPDGGRVAFVRQPVRAGAPRPLMEDRPNPWAILVAEVTTGKATEVWRSGSRLEDSLPSMAGENLLQWAAGGGAGQLVFTSEMDGWQHLYSVPAGGGTPRLLTPGQCEYEQMALTPDKREVVFSSNCGDIDRRHLWQVAVESGEPRAVTSGSGIEWGPVVTSRGRQIAFISSTDRQPASLRVRLADGTVRSIAAETLPRRFPAARLVSPQPVEFTAADGLKIHGQLFLPPGVAPGTKLPAVIFMHGGPMRQMLLGWHNRYYYHGTYGFNQYLAGRGYAVLSVNYRLGIGYGRAFRMAARGGGRGASEYQDIVAAAHYLRGRAEVDSARIGLWGGSYGGYLTALGLARNSDLFAAGVDLHGVHDWSTRISNTNWIDYGDREAVRVAREASPVGSIESWRSPVLLIHGDDDRNVAFSQTVDLVRRLREVGVPHETMVYPDEVHDFLLHRHWMEIYRATADFFDRQLRDRKVASSPGLDLLIRGGSVIDGGGGAPVRADVGIVGDRIVFIGDAAKEQRTAQRTIEARGLIVAPGFIDPHTHAAEDLSTADGRSNQNFLFQGVTTVFTGNDGNGPFPVGEALSRWQQQGIGTNAILYVGHGTVRQRVLGMSDAAPTPEQLDRMKDLVREAMRDGAFGMSTGLYYSPGSYAKTEEVIALARVVAEAGGVYDTHMRDESSYNIGVIDSIRETIRIGREAKLPVHISHIKMLGVDVWGRSEEAIRIIDEARRDGVNVSANQYPYTASGTSVTAALVPRWAEVGGNSELIKRIDDPAVRPRLIAEMETNLRRRGGANSLLITGGRDRSLVGRRLDAIAAERGTTPIEAALAIIKNGGAGVASFNMSEKDIELFMKQPWVMTGSDGSGGHPRKYGTYPRKIRDYVLTRGVISLPRMIEASSRQVAETLGVRNRGEIAPGRFADIVVFDEKTIAEKATYEQPAILSTGMRYVIVNGKVAIDDGKYTGILAGRALKRVE